MDKRHWIFLCLHYIYNDDCAYTIINKEALADDFFVLSMGIVKLIPSA